MKQRQKHIFFISLILLLITTGACKSNNSSVINDNPYKIGVVRNNYLMEHFQMTKELKQDEETIIKSFELYVDSLEKELGVKEQQITSSSLPDVRKKGILEKEYNNYYNQRAEVEENYKKVEFENQLMVIKRLNGYIDEFAKENDFDLIVGATDEGSILFSKEEHDITDRLIEYANKKYNGN